MGKNPEVQSEIRTYSFEVENDSDCRRLLRCGLSPQAYEFVHSCWWHDRFYWPPLAASVFVRRTPEVLQFPVGHTPELVHQLRGINVFAPTEMCSVTTRYESEKGKVGATTRLSTLCCSINSGISRCGS